MVYFYSFHVSPGNDLGRIFTGSITAGAGFLPMGYSSWTYGAVGNWEREGEVITSSVFCPTKEEVLKNYKRILDYFGLVFGLNIRFDKSTIIQLNWS